MWEWVSIDESVRIPLDESLSDPDLYVKYDLCITGEASGPSEFPLSLGQSCRIPSSVYRIILQETSHFEDCREPQYFFECLKSHDKLYNDYGVLYTTVVQLYVCS